MAKAAAETSTEAGVIADLAVKAAAAASIMKTDDGRSFLIVPDGMKHHQITREHAVPTLRPQNVTQGVTLQAVDSLVDYIDRFKTADTVLFANIDANSITAIIDYHVAQSGVAALPEGTPQANHLKHTGTLSLPFSEEWRTWTEASNKGLMEQLAFARFLEENGGDVTAPPGGELLEVCRDLQAKRSVNFTKAVRTSSDNESFEYTDRTDLSDRGDIEVPTKFELHIPVYFGEETTQLFAYLRWAIDPEKGGLKIGVKLSRAEYVRQAWFKQIVLAIADRTACPVVYGKAD
jgi:uncharacterized protein YfdQ (DUF2303 family)